MPKKPESPQGYGAQMFYQPSIHATYPRASLRRRTPAAQTFVVGLLPTTLASSPGPEFTWIPDIQGLLGTGHGKMRIRIRTLVRAHAQPEVPTGQREHTRTLGIQLLSHPSANIPIDL